MERNLYLVWQGNRFKRANSTGDGSLDGQPFDTGCADKTLYRNVFQNVTDNLWTLHRSSMCECNHMQPSGFNLTMVLTTANFIATGCIPVSLPQASRAQVEKHQDRTIDIAVGGDVYFDGKPISKDEFEHELATLPPETSFLIRADRNLPFQGFIDVADILKRLNFTRVGVQTQSVSK
jgi:biopolymer transport protein ExbD